MRIYGNLIITGGLLRVSPQAASHKRCGTRHSGPPDAGRRLRRVQEVGHFSVRVARPFPPPGWNESFCFTLGGGGYGNT